MNVAQWTPSPHVTSPASQVVTAGASAQFQVSSDASGATYQWRRDGQPIIDDARHAGAGTNTLVVNPVELADSGAMFDAVVTSEACGSTTSVPAMLTVTCVPAQFALHPQGVTKSPCREASFTVQVSSQFPVSYQWRRNGTFLNDSARLIGTTTPHLRISPVGDVLDGVYDVLVTNSCGLVVSDPAVLTIRAGADVDGDGDIGTDNDIAEFFSCLAGLCCPTCDDADFNGDGDIGTDADIESFFRVLAGGPC